MIAALVADSRDRLTTMFWAAVIVAVITCAPATSAESHADTPSCPQVEVIFARGTFEAPGTGTVGQRFIDSLNARLPAAPVSVYAVNYPASLDFDAATQGIADASDRIVSQAARCPDTKLVLGGYSQGAAVAAYTTFDSVPPGLSIPVPLAPLPASAAEHVAAVVLFGTPDNWFLNLVARDAPPITVGHLYADKTIQLCADGDPVCFPGGLDRSAHSSYKTNSMPDQAAAFVAALLTPYAGTD